MGIQLVLLFCIPGRTSTIETSIGASGVEPHWIYALFCCRAGCPREFGDIVYALLDVPIQLA
jgi:hypothetical protein